MKKFSSFSLPLPSLHRLYSWQTLLLLLVLSLAAAACDSAVEDDDPTVNVSGTWKFEYSSVVAGFITEIKWTLNLEQDGSDIAGSHTNGSDRICGSSFGCSTDRPPSGTVQGSVRGNEITLEFDFLGNGNVNRISGVVDGDKMGGDLSALIIASWSASRVR